LKSQRARAESPAQKTPTKKRRRFHAAAPLALMIFCIRFPWAAPKAVMPSRRWRSAGSAGAFSKNNVTIALAADNIGVSGLG
jgi:hypothetical protein